MVVAGLTIDPINNAPIVLLREKDSDRVLPIWIGVIEASAIAFELEQVKLRRPMAHDLLKQIITLMQGKVERVAVVDLKDNTYYAVIVLSHGGRTIEVDARPSDAIALALRAKAPILCDTKVIAAAQARSEGEKQPEAAATTSEEDVDRGEDGPRPLVGSNEGSWREVLESLEPEAFGKYKM